MILAAAKEELDALFIVGANPIFNYPDGQFVKDGFDKLDFVVVADLFETESSQLADVVLPLSSWAEYPGRFVNMEGRVQEFEAAVKPIGLALPGYEMVGRIAREMRAPLFENTDDLNAEVTRLLEIEPVRHLPEGLQSVKYTPASADDDYPVPLLVVDQLHHFGHWTEKTRSLVEFCGEAFVEMSPALAEKLELADGSIVRIESEVGKLNLPVKISDVIDSDVVLAYRNFSARVVNSLQMRKRRIDRVRLTRVEGA